MPSLEQTQAAMMQAIDLGPDFLPDGLFASRRSRAMLGLKVHANTISHARLIALEDTFPKTRAAIGAESFNQHSRRFIDWPGVTARPLMRIGEDFADFLAASGEAMRVVDLAGFEWLWLEAYHACDAPAARLADLAGRGEADLLEVMLARHPAAHLRRFDAAVHHLIGEEVPGLDQADAILIARPQAEVLISPATWAMRCVFAELQAPTAIRNLFEEATEPDCKDRLPPDDIMPALIALIEAGALQQVG